jgi:hypothetical protein
MTKTLDGTRYQYFVVDGARLLFGLTATGLVGEQLFEDGDIVSKGPAAISLMLLGLAALVMIAFAIASLLDKNLSEDKWMNVEHSQMGASAVALLSSAFYAGLMSDGKAIQFDQVPGILVLVLGIMKAMEHVARVFETSQYEAADGVALAKLQHHTKQGVLSLLLAVGIFLGAALTVDKTVPKVQGKDFVKGEDFKDRAVEGIRLGVAILLPTATALTTIVQSCVKDVGIHEKVNQIASLSVFTALVLLAVEVGSSFLPGAYPGDIYLSANFWYLAALIFGGLGALQLEGYRPATKKATPGRMMAHGVSAVFFIAAVAIGTLWSMDTLYDELKNQTLVETDNKTLMYVGGVPDQGVALSLYGLIFVLTVSAHVIVTQLIEMILISGILENFTPCIVVGLFNEQYKVKGSDELTPKRAEQTLVYVIVSGVFFATQSGSVWDVSVSILFFLILAARFMGFYANCIAGRPTETGSNTCCAKVMLWLWDKEKAVRLDYTGEKEGSETHLMGILALFLSAVPASLYVFFNTLPWKEKGDLVTLAWFEFVSLMLIYVHVALTALAGCAWVSAAAVPILRFGVSSFVLLTFAWSLAERAFEDGTYTLATPALLLYLAYDANADADF